MGGTSSVKVVGVSVLDQLKVLHAAAGFAYIYEFHPGGCRETGPGSNCDPIARLKILTHKIRAVRAF